MITKLKRVAMFYISVTDLGLEFQMIDDRFSGMELIWM